ncbi:MAG: flagellar basal body L-ring protein FlgH [Sphingomonas sp.]|jgi:flagellar L-ring protein precursor FlgH|uniref:flagellar basal body L-ring protein FlgH n=1 Tax=Sphingomonas sp. TaxID=28214 RepID=UPI00356A0E8D
MKKTLALLLLASTLAGCGIPGRLASVGKPPKLSPSGTDDGAAIEPSLSAPSDRRGPARSAVNPALAPAPNASLFRTGAGAFFRDQRASQKGDILTIRINISDKADLGNSTTRTRGGTETSGISALLGLQNPLTKILPGQVDPSKLVDTKSASGYNGAGTVARSEKINMTMAAIVTDVMPNGNLMIRGRQEVRVNFEMRELIVTGIVRPEDIGRDNSIAHTQIAEARIIYGGKGQLTDAQQARWGQQIYDALFPF